MSANHQRIYNFILLLVANRNNTDDIMQETSIFMYEKFNDFEKGSDFLAWAKTIARYKTFEFLRKNQREKVVFSAQIAELIDRESQDRTANYDEWLDMLRQCISRLQHIDQRLLQIRYYENISITAIAKRFGCSFQKIYRDMARINDSLVHCIRLKIRSDEF